MLILLPPSETKRAGGDPDRPLALAALSRPGLNAPRRATLAQVAELSRNLRTAASALGLGPRTAQEAELNRQLRRGPTMPALDRFDGVLYDALAAGELDLRARHWLGEHVAIASALFGLLAPEDRIPAYRLSADTRLPGASLRGIWERALGDELGRESGFVLDLRSEAYASLGPAPPSAAYLRVVTGAGSRRRPLNHLNKAAKGRLVRALAESEPSILSRDDLIGWGEQHGLSIRPGAVDELDLEVGEPEAEALSAR